MRKSFIAGFMMCLCAPLAHAQVPVGMFADVEGTCIVQSLSDKPCAIGHTVTSGQLIEVEQGSSTTIVLHSGATFAISGETVVEVFADGVFVISGEMPTHSADNWSAAPAVIQAGQRFEVGAVRMRGFGDDAPPEEPLPPAPDEDARFASRLMYAMTLLRHGQDDEALARLQVLRAERPDAEFIRRVLADYGR